MTDVNLATVLYYSQMSLCWPDRYQENPHQQAWTDGDGRVYHALISLQEISRPYKYEEHNPFLWDVYDKRDEESPMNDFAVIMNRLAERRRQYLAALSDLRDWFEDVPTGVVSDRRALITEVRAAEEACLIGLVTHELRIRSTVSG